LKLQTSGRRFRLEEGFGPFIGEGAGDQADRDKATQAATPADNSDRLVSLIVANNDPPPPA